MIDKDLIDRGFVKHSSGLWVNREGEVFVPRNYRRQEHFTYGSKTNQGYMQVQRNGKGYFVHRIVAECFIQNDEDRQFIDHINTVRNDNRVDNLRWVTIKENRNNTLTTENQRNAQINNIKQSKAVLQYTLTGEFVREWSSTAECGRNGFDQGSVCRCCNGKLKKYKGFLWRYN